MVKSNNHRGGDHSICNQHSLWRLANIFNAVLLDLTAGITDSFEHRGAYSRGACGFPFAEARELPTPHCVFCAYA